MEIWLVVEDNIYLVEKMIFERLNVCDYDCLYLN